LRSADPELVRQEVWAHLAVHHCLTWIIMRLASQERIDPDRISFIKVLKHVRRSVIRQSAQTSVQIKQLMVTMAAKVRRKLDNGIRRLREADRSLKRPASKYSFRKAGQVRRPTPPGGRQGAHAPPRDRSVSQATALGNQAAVPGQQGSRSHDPVQPQPPGQQPRQGGEHGTVSPVRPRTRDLPPQDRDLVPQHEDLRILRGIAPHQQRQPAEYPDHEQVDQSDERERRA
jgi:hypothetical protein